MYIYSTNEIRAANLFYLVIKDHPFLDGNKRIGCLLFILYLKKCKINLELINNNTLIALALLIAESDPKQKEILVKLTVYLLH